jgi:hypothetical protein
VLAALLLLPFPDEGALLPAERISDSKAECSSTKSAELSPAPLLLSPAASAAARVSGCIVFASSKYRRRISSRPESRGRPSTLCGSRMVLLKARAIVFNRVRTCRGSIVVRRAASFHVKSACVQK